MGASRHFYKHRDERLRRTLLASNCLCHCALGFHSSRASSARFGVRSRLSQTRRTFLEFLHVAAEAAAIAFVGHAATSDAARVSRRSRISSACLRMASLVESRDGCQLGLFEHAFSFLQRAARRTHGPGAPARPAGGVERASGGFLSGLAARQQAMRARLVSRHSSPGPSWPLAHTPLERPRPIARG